MMLRNADKRDYDAYFLMLFRLFNKLKKQRKLNPNYKTTRKETEEIIHYFDWCRDSLNAIDYILNGKMGVFDNFKKDVKKYGITEKKFIGIYSSLLMYGFLLMYANIENMMLVMLKGAKYGLNKSQIIRGTEPLGPLLDKIDKLVPKNNLPKDILDVKFRNALAHGWYKIVNNKFTYFEDSSLTKPITLELGELFLKHRKLNLLGVALGELVLAADWE